MFNNSSPHAKDAPIESFLNRCGAMGSTRYR